MNNARGSSTLRNADVLMGRGGGSHRSAGNVLFRSLVAQHRALYQAATVTDRSGIRNMIIAAIAESGGRFVEETIDAKKKIVYRPVCRRLIMRKVSQALREKGKPKCDSNEATPIALASLPNTRIEAPLNSSDLRAIRAPARETRGVQPISPLKPSTDTRKRAIEDSLACQRLETRSSPASTITSMVRYNPGLPTCKMTFGRRFPIDVLDLVCMPLVPSPDRMWSTPPQVKKADLPYESLELKDTCMCCKARDTSGGSPTMMERIPGQNGNWKFPTPNRLDSIQSDSQSSENSKISPGPQSAVPSSGCMPTLVCRAFDSVTKDRPMQDLPFGFIEVHLHAKNPTRKNRTDPEDSLDNIYPPTPCHSPFEHKQSPQSSLSKDECSTVVDYQGSQDTISTSPSFHLIRPKQTKITDVGPRHRIALAETTSVCLSDSEDIESGRTDMLPESVTETSSPMNPETTRFPLPTLAMEQVSIRERSPDPMAMFASTILSSDEQTMNTTDSFVAEGSATWPTWSSRSAFVPYCRVIRQESGAPSPLVASACLSSGTIPPSRLTRSIRDLAFIDATLKKARASRILEFADPSWFRSNATMSLKSNVDEATDSVALKEQRPASSVTAYTKENCVHLTKAKSRVRRVSDVTERLSKENSESEKATVYDQQALPCPPRRVSL